MTRPNQLRGLTLLGHRMFEVRIATLRCFTVERGQRCASSAAETAAATIASGVSADVAA